jgi:prephenate dehydrogenase
MKPTVGIIGYGSFGAFMCRQLLDLCEVRVFDSLRDVPSGLRVDISHIATMDYVVLAIPLDAYEAVCTTIKPHLGSNTVIVDIASVKTTPAQLLRSLLPDVKKVFTHPLFGPQSASHSLEGHTLVVCPEVSDASALESLISFATKLGLVVIEKSAKDHDTEMAYAQGLTFFVARALMYMNVHAIQLQTPSFRKLLDLAYLETQHSEELFLAIQKGNPAAKELRKEFMRHIERLDKSLDV